MNATVPLKEEKSYDVLYLANIGIKEIMVYCHGLYPVPLLIGVRSCIFFALNQCSSGQQKDAAASF